MCPSSTKRAFCQGVILFLYLSQVVSSFKENHRHIRNRHNQQEIKGCQYYDDSYKNHTVECNGIELQVGLPTVRDDVIMDKLYLRNVSGALNNETNIPQMSHLTYLSIKDSNLTVFQPFLRKLHFLVILNNRNFPAITKSMFQDVPNLNWLSIIGNEHIQFETDSLTHLSNLTWLHLQNEKFPVLTDAFLRNSSKLHELTITNCNLSEIDSNAFRGCPDLEILSLNFNKLKRFHLGTFDGLKSLKIFELHHNHFVDFTWDQFRGLTSVEIMGFPSNFLPHIEIGDLMKTLPSLRKMEIKKHDLLRNETQVLVRKLRERKIEIIGTPHDCYLPPFFYCHKPHKFVKH